MFERSRVDPATPAGSAGVLDASSIAAWQAGLAAALDPAHARAGAGPRGGLDDAGRAEAIRALEELICTATAAQAALAADLDASRRAADVVAGRRSADHGRGVASLVAHARRESPHRGALHLGLAKIVPVELPRTWAAWRTGRVREWTATLIARETACLSLEHRLAVDEAIADDPRRLERLGGRELVASLRAHAERLDPAAVVKRRRRAEAQRHLTLRPAPDTMTWLTALLPVKDGVAVYAALTEAADTARATGDPRGKGQLMADTLVTRVTGQASPSAATPVQLGLVMSDQALFGGSDQPAHLDGYGPVPAELAREILARALSTDERVWVRRLYTSPDTGELVTMDARTRCFRGSLARFIRLRDRTCRTPWCDAPIRHLDHAQPEAEGGPTSAHNGQGLCEACNHAKQGTGWRVRPGPDGSIETTLPTGHTYRTRAPALATIRHAQTPPLRIDYLLTG